MRRAATTRASGWLAGGLACAIGLAHSALGQETPAAEASGWSFRASVYLWTPSADASVETDRGNLKTDASASDLISQLDGAFMGTLEGQRDRWGFLVDIVYVDLSQKEGTPFGDLYSHARLQNRLGAFSGYLGYRVHQDQRATVDLLAGGRIFNLNSEVSLSPGRLRGRTDQLNETWIDPLAGVRGRLAITDHWFATAAADVGGTSLGSDFTWQYLATAGYQVDDRWSVQAGWRYLDVEKRISGRDTSLQLSGPIFGVSFKF